VLNPDCEWREGGIRVLVAWLREHARCAIAAPRIVNSDGSLEYSARSYPSPFAFLFNRYSLLTKLWPGNPWTRRYLLSDWDHASPRSVDWVSGAAMLVRRSAVAAVGGMDEVFFMFNEDVDWCRRMNLAGWTVDYVPPAETVHHIGASRGEVSDRVILERHRGMIHYFRKHHPAPGPLDALAALVIMTRAHILVFLNRRPR
jgi:GT2 family glycosyltransferase